MLLKLGILDPQFWDEEFLSLELGHSVSEIKLSLQRLKDYGFLNPDDKKFNLGKTIDFILNEIHEQFPTRPGAKARGMITGAKPGNYFAIDLPYISIWVWPNSQGQEQGFEIEPLSPHCCFAAANDSRLKHLLAITETMRVAGTDARGWAKVQLDRVLMTKEAKLNYSF